MSQNITIMKVLLFLLFSSGCFVHGASVEKSESEVNVFTANSNVELDKLLQGKWRQVSWRQNASSGYQEYPEHSNVYKMYSQGQFYFFDYGLNGELYTAYGGTYEVLSDSLIRETITFFGPYKRTSGAPNLGQLVLFNGKTMVGSVSELSVKIEESRLYLSGTLKQNIRNIDSPDRYGNRYLDNGYIKLHN